MPRKSMCWDTYTAEVVVLDSSDDDEVPGRTRKARIGARKPLISSPECSPENLTTRRLQSKFRIKSDSSSESDDCVVYSSDEDKALPPVSSKVIDLTLPKFSYETPDKKTSLKNRKLLSDISNRCGTPLKPGANRERKPLKGRCSKGQRNSNELKPEEEADRNNRLFDALIGASVDGKSDSVDIRSCKNSENDRKSSRIKINDSYNNAFLAFHDIIKAKTSRGAKYEDDELSSLVPATPGLINGDALDAFKKPKTFKKQREISNKVKRPGDSKIVSRRTDDSDSTDHSVDSQRCSTPRRTPSKINDLLTSLGPSAEDPSPDPWDEPVSAATDTGDFYVKESPRPIKKRGKAYCLTALKTALDDIEAQSGDQLSFLSSLDCSVSPKSCHPTALIYKEKFNKKKEELALILFKMFNKDVFDLKLPEDMTLEWSGRMTSSAGITHLSRKMVSGEWKFLSRITLSKPIVTTAARLRDTLIHEMCHAAVWLLDHKKDGHGSYWKAWTYKAREAFPDLRPINTCHSYSRDWKFTWECVSCGYTIGRMTKSFDTQRFTCGRCHGRFELKENKNKPKRVANGFAKYVKENYASVKSDKGLPHKEVMKTLSQQYQNQKTNSVPSVNDPDDGDVELISSGDDYGDV